MSGHVLVLGGARSGKSAYAERAALALGSAPAYLATAEAGDQEMAQRIARHRDERDARFKTFEEPLGLVAALDQIGSRHDLVLVDCLSLWISNLMGARADVAEEVAGLEAWLAGHVSPRLVMVSNEVGSGIVPDNAMAREFRDLAGSAHQLVASRCESVVLSVAGIALALKGELPV